MFTVQRAKNLNEGIVFGILANVCSLVISCFLHPTLQILHQSSEQPSKSGLYPVPPWHHQPSVHLCLVIALYKLENLSVLIKRSVCRDYKQMLSWKYGLVCIFGVHVVCSCRSQQRQEPYQKKNVFVEIDEVKVWRFYVAVQEQFSVHRMTQVWRPAWLLWPSFAGPGMRRRCCVEKRPHVLVPWSRAAVIW